MKFVTSLLNFGGRATSRMGTATGAGASVVAAVIVVVCTARSCCWRVLIVSYCCCINARSCSIVGAALCCYDIRTSDGDGRGENSSSSEVSSYEDVRFSSSERIVAKLN